VWCEVCYVAARSVCGMARVSVMSVVCSCVWCCVVAVCGGV
jgi:hypothetical protein